MEQQKQKCKEYKNGYRDAIDDFFIEIITAYYNDDIDECKINTIERNLKNRLL